MLTNFFGKSKPITILVILALFFSYFFVAFVNTSVDFKVLPSFLLLLAIINFINSKNELSFDNSYVFLFSVVLIGLFPEIFALNTVFYSNLTILLFLRKIYSLQSPKKTLKKTFDAGLWLGVSVLIEPFCFVFIVLLYFSIFIHQRISFRTLIIPVVGCITPIVLYFTYCFWYDKMADFLLLFDWFTSYDFTFYSKSNQHITLYVVLFTIVMSILLKTPKALSVKNDFRRSWLILLLNFISALVLFVLIQNEGGSGFLYLVFPSAIIVANAIEIYQKKWFTDVIIISAIVASLLLSFI